MMSFLVAIKDDPELNYSLLEHQVLSCLRVNKAYICVGLSANRHGHLERLTNSKSFQHPRVTINVTNDAGLYEGWNVLIERANTDWVSFLGLGDCVVVPDYYNDLLKGKEIYSVNAYFSRVLIADKAKGRLFGRPFRLWRHRIKQEVAFAGAVFRRSLFLQHPFDPVFRVAGDYEWLLRNAANLISNFSSAVCVVMPAGGISEIMSECIKYELKQAKKLNASR